MLLMDYGVWFFICLCNNRVKTTMRSEESGFNTVYMLPLYMADTYKFAKVSQILTLFG